MKEEFIESALAYRSATYSKLDLSVHQKINGGGWQLLSVAPIFPQIELHPTASVFTQTCHTKADLYGVLHHAFQFEKDYTFNHPSLHIEGNCFIMMNGFPKERRITYISQRCTEAQSGYLRRLISSFLSPHKEWVYEYDSEELVIRNTNTRYPIKHKYNALNAALCIELGRYDLVSPA